MSKMIVSGKDDLFDYRHIISWYRRLYTP